MGVRFTASAVLPLVAALLAAAPAAAEPTPVTVRVLSQDAKFVGDGTGGAAVVLRDAESGRVLAKGIVRGSTGDTGRIMHATGRSPQRATPGAAAFEATLDLVRPTLVELEVRGALGRPGSAVRATAQRWMMPGDGITDGDGWTIELPGLAVTPTVTVDAAGVAVAAKVEPMCGCPITPGGLWDAADYSVSASLWQGDRRAADVAIPYVSAPGGYGATLPRPAAGRYVLVVYARNRVTGATGLSRTAVTVP